MDMKILLIGAVVLIFGADIVYTMNSKKKSADLLQQLNTLLANEEYEEFEKLIDTPEVKKSFTAYNVAFMKLNKAMMKNNPSEITQAFANFNIKMNPVQRETVLKRAFYYYIGVKDFKRTEHYYNLLKDMNVKDQVTLDIMYDTYVNKGYRYLEEVLNNYERLSEEDQAPYIALIADMYKNKGDNEKAKEFEDKTQKIIQEINNF